MTEFTPAGQYVALRAVILAAFLAQFLTGRLVVSGDPSAWYVVGVYALSMVVYLVLTRFGRRSWRSGLWRFLAVDIAFVGSAVFIGGGLSSNLYILFYVIAAFCSYHLGLQTGFITATAATIAYAIPCLYHSGLVAMPDVLFRSAILWIIGIAMGMASRETAQSTARLLNAMDKLNERTTELERSHAQIQTIYETSRSLAQLQSEKNVISQVLHIARNVLSYPVCEVYTWDRETRRLRLKGRVSTLGTELFDQPPAVVLSETFRNVIGQREVVRIADRHLGKEVYDGRQFRSQMAVPMVTEGKIIGLINAESPEIRAFSDHDERVCSTLASSAALALANADLHCRMEKLTVEDELTGLYNFRYFSRRLEDEKRRAVRYGQPLSLVMIDIDWFKQLNDRHGHETGNVALKQLAKVVAPCIRDVDILARYGGEEFVVILPQTGIQEASVIGERIRRQVEEAKFGPDAAGNPIRLTVSIGISSYPENGRPEDAIVESVDRALYQAKGAGKNAVRLSSSIST